ncbi:MAG: glycosyltransferase family 4 protein [Nonlabens sp.]
MKKIVIIGNNIPEPSSTAAGGRMMQLISIFQKMRMQVIFCCATMPGERSVDLENLGVAFQHIELNKDSFNQWIITTLPDFVLYDRFYIEEQYGWRVAETCPQARTILDTEDLHFLRKARQRALKEKIDFDPGFFNHPGTYREIASIKRCDLSLIISSYEMNLLKNTFQIEPQKLFYIPLLVDSNFKVSKPNFSDTRDFFHIGNFMHAPNEDAVWQLKKHIWPKIHKQLPNANLHIYGAYPKPKHLNWHNEKEGFLVHGAVEEISEAFDHKRILLTPLRFGAGLKGKIIDAMQFGVPVVTTNIGAEGIAESDSFNGFIAEADNDDFTKNAIRLYTQAELWEQMQKNGFELVQECFEESAFAKALTKRISKIMEEPRPQITFNDQMLSYHSSQHLKFKGKWIAIKESLKCP